MAAGGTAPISADHAEVERLDTRSAPDADSIGAVIFGEIGDAAPPKGVATEMIETGEAQALEPACRLYENAGFTMRGAFLDHTDSGWSRLHEKSLR
jgi:putative acetyltransferase